MTTTPQHDSRPLLCGRLLVGVTGSPSAMQMPNTVLLLRQGLVDRVDVMMTRNATRFVRPSVMRLFSGSWVHTDLHHSDSDVAIPHIDLTRDTDLLLVMPSTANMLAKAANGICDDLVSTAIVACPAPVVLVPSMNESMWRSVVVQANVERAREVGYHVLAPGLGMHLADASNGLGAMPPIEQLLGSLTEIVTQPASTRAEPAPREPVDGLPPPAPR